MRACAKIAQYLLCDVIGIWGFLAPNVCDVFGFNEDALKMSRLEIISSYGQFLL